METTESKFEIFAPYFEPLSKMVEFGVFDVRNGMVGLHFDSLGVLRKIERSDILFLRKQLSPLREH